MPPPPRDNRPPPLPNSGAPSGQPPESTPPTALPPLRAPAALAPPRPLSGVPAGLRDHPTYEVVRELGRGGMGVVYLARNKVMKRLEVLKVLQGGLANSPDMARRFLNEVQMAARLHHPNVVTAYAAFQAGEAVVLAMEHVEGFNLAQLVERKGPLPVAHACAFARQAALGLQKAHEEKMVHRDIKPHNLMVSRAGQVKVLDFGLAKAASEEVRTKLDGPGTVPGTMMGTPDYMSPEQATDAKEADIRSDIYSLGATLYFLLAGRPPFTGSSIYEVVYAHQKLPVPPLAAYRADLPGDLVALVARMLAKRPEERPQTPGEVAAALARFAVAPAAIEARPVPCVPPPPPRPSVPQPSSTLRAPPRETVVSASETAPVPQRRRRRWGATLLAAGAFAALVAGVAWVWLGGSGQQPTEGGGGPPRGGEASLTPGPVKTAPPPGPLPQAGPPQAVINSIGMKFVLIPAGSFKMGSPDDEKGRYDYEAFREVKISKPFYLGVHEVTQEEYEKVIKANPSFFSPRGRGKDKLTTSDTSRFPVETVSWDEAIEFCRKLSDDPEEKKAGRKYQLPTEAQWEYSCRAGSKTTYHTGEVLTTEHANFDKHVGQPRAVGSYPASRNSWGLYDMHGNVWEWCRDWFEYKYYKSSPLEDPLNTATSQWGRACRGGGWDSDGRACRSAACGSTSYVAGYLGRSANLGFRVSLIVPDDKP